MHTALGVLCGADKEQKGKQIDAEAVQQINKISEGTQYPYPLGKFNERKLCKYLMTTMAG